MKKTIAALTLAISSISLFGATTASAVEVSTNDSPSQETRTDPAPSQEDIDAAIAQHVRDVESGKAVVGESKIRPWKLNGYEISVTSVQYGTVMPVVVASCGYGGTGGVCHISKTVSLKGSISAGAGLNIEAFNVNTNYEIEASHSVTISAPSPKLTSRQMFVARPQGTFYMFKWKNYNWGVNNASGTGTAFSPTGVQFRVVPI